MMSHARQETALISFGVGNAAIIMAGCIALSACGNRNIDNVKALKLDVDPSFTVGEVFDNRDVCESVSWDTAKDKRGRTIVEYRCAFKGVKDFVQKNIQNYTDSMNKEAQARKDGYVQQMSDLQSQIDEKKKELADDQASPAASNPNSIDADHQAKIQMLTNQLAILNTGDVNKIAVIQLDPQLGFKDMDAAIRCYNAAQPGSTAQSQCADSVKQTIPATVYWMNTFRDQLQEAVKKDVSKAQGANNFNIAALQQQIPAFQTRLNETASEEDAFLASVDDDLKQNLANVAPNPLKSVEEIFQWVVTDEGDVTLVYAGTEAKRKDGTENDTAYQRPDRAMQLMAQNSAKTYADYNNRIAYL